MGDQGRHRSNAAMASLARRFVDRYGGALRDRVNAFVADYSLIGDPTVFDPGQFEWTETLRQDWQAIRDEFAAKSVDDPTFRPISDISADHSRLDTGKRWHSAFLWGYGVRIPENCRRYPKTAELVERVPGLLTAMFSVHQPGAHLPSHKGVTKGMITAHLGLDVPRSPERCRINVSGEHYAWEEGRWFIFDDTARHEVWNDTDRRRVILLLHVKRPMFGVGRLVQSAFFRLITLSPFVRDAARNIERYVEKATELPASAPTSDDAWLGAASARRART